MHLRDGVGYGAQAVVVAEGGRFPMIPRHTSSGPTFEVGVVGRYEVGLHILPGLIVGSAPSVLLRFW